MAQNKKYQPGGDGQLSIFDALESLAVEPSPETPPVKTQAKTAIWTDSFEPHVDYICDSDPLVIFCYDIQELEEINFCAYNQRPFEKLLEGLGELSKSYTPKKLRSKSFTIYNGDIAPGFYLYGIGLATSSSDIVQFMGSFLQQVEVSSRIVVDTSTSEAASLVPRFRYDKGYVIEYVGEEGAGISYVDDDDNYKSGITIYRRAYKPSYFINKRRSVYGKLVNEPV